jgi:hypothetical protein
VIQLFISKPDATNLNDTFSILITEVLNEIVDGQTLKYINYTNSNCGFDYSNSGTYVEQLGFYHGPFIPVCDAVVGNYFPNELRCYQSSTLRYVAPLSIACDSIVGYQPVSITAISNHFNIAIYPNPAHQHLHIATEDAIIQNVMLYDVLGRLIITLKPNAAKVQLSVANISSGSYSIKVITDKGIVAQQIILQH